MSHANDRHDPRWHHQRDELHGSAIKEFWQLTSLPIARTRVPRMPAIPSHSSAALEAKAHGLVERMAAFSPPAMLAAEVRSQVGSPPYLLGVQPF